VNIKTIKLTVVKNTETGNNSDIVNPLTMKQITTLIINNINKPTALLQQMKFVHDETT